MILSGLCGCDRSRGRGYHGATDGGTMKLYDYPDFSAANPWQHKTIDTAAPMPVVRSSQWPPPADCPLVHVGWEDWLMRGTRTETEADQRAGAILDSLDVCRRRGQRILWTVHNLTSHWLPWKAAEQRLRAGIGERAAVVFLMAEKHRPLVPFVPPDKIVVVPHYAEENRYVVHREAPTVRPRFFKYGAPRGGLADSVLQAILNSPRFDKFVSDKRLSKEVVDDRNVMVKRRFTPEESLLYAALAHFTLFIRSPVLNSGVFTYCCASRLAVFHTADAVQHLDVPPGLDAWRIDPASFTIDQIAHALATQRHADANLTDWIADRAPGRVSAAWWRAAGRP
ncbi:MAG: hypothetical protein WCR51_12250 [Planctomycetia bacterium]